jgi:hypothetical protein
MGGTRRRSGSKRASTSGATRPHTPPDGRDFVRQNIVEAGTHRKTSDAPAPDGSEFLSKSNYGRVPSYLHERNMELAANYAKQQVRQRHIPANQVRKDGLCTTCVSTSV